MAVIELCIDFGSYSTVIYRIGKGLVLSEPNKVLCENVNGESIIKDFGQKAVKQNDEQFVVSPIMEGNIVDEKYAGLLLRNFVKKVVADKPKASIRALFGIPCGTSLEERQKYFNVAYSAGISTIDFAPTPVADILGCGVGFNDFENCLLVDIGSGCTDIAIMGKQGIVEGLTLNVGAVNIDFSIMSQVQSKYGVKISLESAASLKEQIGSLLPNGTKNLSFTGIETKTKQQKTIKITSIDILEPLREYYQLIAETANSLVAAQESVVINNVRNQGVIFCGNGSKISGLKEFMQQMLNIPIFVASGERCVFGLAKLMEQKSLLKKLT